MEDQDAVARQAMGSRDHHRAMGSRTEVDTGTTEEQVPLVVTRMAAA